MPNEDALYNLWNYTKNEYDLGDYNSFKISMEDSTARSNFHKYAGSKYDLGDYGSFESSLGYGQQKKPPIAKPKLPANMNPQQVKRYFSNAGVTLTDTQTRDIAGMVSGKSMEEAMSLAANYLRPKVAEPVQEEVDNSVIPSSFQPMPKPERTMQEEFPLVAAPKPYQGELGSVDIFEKPDFAFNRVGQEITRPKTQSEVEQNISMSMIDEFKKKDKDLDYLYQLLDEGKLADIDLGPLGHIGLGKLTEQRKAEIKLGLMSAKAADGSAKYITNLATIKTIQEESTKNIARLMGEVESMNNDPNNDPQLLKKKRGELFDQVIINQVSNKSQKPFEKLQLEKKIERADYLLGQMPLIEQAAVFTERSSIPIASLGLSMLNSFGEFYNKYSGEAIADKIWTTIIEATTDQEFEGPTSTSFGDAFKTFSVTKQDDLEKYKKSDDLLYSAGQKSVLDGLNAANFGNAFGQIGGSMAVVVGASLTGGPQAGVIAGYSMVYGDAVDAARKAGFNEVESEIYGQILAIGTGLLEELPVGKLLEGWTTSMLKKSVLNLIRTELRAGTPKATIIKKVTDYALETTAKGLQQGIAEGSTEFLQGGQEFVTQAAFNNYFKEKEDPGFELPTFKQFGKQSAEAFVLGFFGGGGASVMGDVGGAFSAGSNTYSKLAQAAIRDNETFNNLNLVADGLLVAGKITKQERDSFVENLKIAQEAKAALPKYIKDDNIRQRSIELILEKKRLEADMATVDPSMQDGYKARLASIQSELKSIADQKWKAPANPVEISTVSGLEAMTTDLVDNSSKDTSAGIFVSTVESGRGFITDITKSLDENKPISRNMADRTVAALESLAKSFGSAPVKTEITQKAAQKAQELADQIKSYSNIQESVEEKVIPGLDISLVADRIALGVPIADLDFMGDVPVDIQEAYQGIMNGDEVSSQDANNVQNVLYAKYKELSDIKQRIQDKLENTTSKDKQKKLSESINAISEIQGKLSEDISMLGRYRDETRINEESTGRQQETKTKPVLSEEVAQEETQQQPTEKQGKLSEQELAEMEYDYSNPSEDISNIIDEQPDASKIYKLLNNAIKFINKIAPNVKIYVHATSQEFYDSVYSTSGKNEHNLTDDASFVIGNDGKPKAVHFNLETMLGKKDPKERAEAIRTFAHEAMHVGLHTIFGDDQKLFKSFQDKLSKVLGSADLASLNDFIKNYRDPNKQDVTAEEFLAELGGMMSAEGRKIPKPILARIAQLINNTIVSAARKLKISVDPNLLFKNTNDTNDVIDFFNTMAESTRTGIVQGVQGKAEPLLKQQTKQANEASQPTGARTTARKTDTDTQVLFTTATKRAFDIGTEILKGYTEKFDDLVKMEYEDIFKMGPDKFNKEFNETANYTLVNYTEILKSNIPRYKAKLNVGMPFLGSWEGFYEPSMNLNINISDETDTSKLSDLFNLISEKTSQDAYIVEMVSDLDDAFQKDPNKLQLFEYQGNGISVYPQVMAKFPREITPFERSQLAQKMTEAKFDSFSIGPDFVKISVFDDGISKDENTDREKEREDRISFFNDQKSIFEKAIKGNNNTYSQGVKLSTQIKRSAFVAGKKTGENELQRKYDRRDVFEAFKPSNAGSTTRARKSGEPGPARGNRLFNQPLTDATTIANKYYESTFGRKAPNYTGTRFLDKAFSKRISDAYVAMKHEPQNLEVAKAYRQLIKETIDQYEEIIAAGYELVMNDNEAYPSSADMIDDLRNNKSMKIFSTEAGFGDNPITDEQRRDNPLLAKTKYKDVNGRPLLANDIFRFVHDFFGHAKLGNSFGAKGEENAWNVHARMYSPLARKAATTELRGQNSYFNFSGDNDKIQALREKGKQQREDGDLKGAEETTNKIYEISKFAEQKVGLLPEEFNVIDETDEGDRQEELGLPVSTTRARRSAPSEVDPAKVASEEMPMSARNILYNDSDVLPKAENKIKNSRVARSFQEAAAKYWGGSIVTSETITPEQEKLITENGIQEAIDALEEDEVGNAANWYSTAIQTAIAVAGVIHTELVSRASAMKYEVFAKEKDPEGAARMVLRMALAITSQNLNVDVNTQYAEEQFDYFKKNGRFDSKKKYGAKAPAISSNLELANTIIAKMGINAAEEFISNGFSVASLEVAFKEATGKKVKITGLRNDDVNGAAIFGPKIGQGFLQNLMGKFDPVTIDLWMRRTWGRWTGDVVGDGITEERMAKLYMTVMKAITNKELKITLPKEFKKHKPVQVTNEKGRTFWSMDDKFSFDRENNMDFVAKLNAISDEIRLIADNHYKNVHYIPMSKEMYAKFLSGELTYVQASNKLKALNDRQKEKYKVYADVQRAKKLKPLAQNDKKLKDGEIIKGWVSLQNEKDGRTFIPTNEELSARKPGWGNAAKNITSDLNPIDIPSNQDRRVITRIVNNIRKGLAERGYEVTNADVQAILWYPEKDIWAKMRGEEESILKLSYDNQFIKIATERGLGEQAEAVAKDIRDRGAKRDSAAPDQGTNGGVRGVANAESTTRARRTQVDSLKDVESTTKALKDVDTQELKKQLAIESNWNMRGEGDFLSAEDSSLSYTKRLLPDWNNASKRGDIDADSKLTYDIGRQAPIADRKLPNGLVIEGSPEITEGSKVYARDENGVTVAMAEMETLADGKYGISHIVVAPEFRGKGVGNNLLKLLKKNNPSLDLSKTKLRSEEFNKAFSNKIISEAYHKAKSDGSNPELVQAVEDVLTSEPQSGTTTRARRTQSSQQYYNKARAADQGTKADRDNQAKIYDKAKAFLDTFYASGGVQDDEHEALYVYLSDNGVDIDPNDLFQLRFDIQDGNRPDFSENKGGKGYAQPKGEKTKKSRVLDRIVSKLEKLGSDKSLNRKIVNKLKESLHYTVQNQDDAMRIAQMVVDEFGGIDGPQDVEDLFDISREFSGAIKTFIVGNVLNEAYKNAKKAAKGSAEQLRYQSIVNNASTLLAERARENGREIAALYKLYLNSPEGMYTIEAKKFLMDVEAAFTDKSQKAKIDALIKELKDAKAEAARLALEVDSVKATIAAATGGPVAPTPPKPTTPKPPKPQTTPTTPTQANLKKERSLFQQLKDKLKSLGNTRARRQYPAGVDADVVDILAELARVNFERGIFDFYDIKDAIAKKLAKDNMSISDAHYTEMWNDIWREAGNAQIAYNAEILAKRIVFKAKQTAPSSAPMTDPIKLIKDELFKRATQDIKDFDADNETEFDKLRRLLFFYGSMTKPIWNESKDAVRRQIDALDPTKYTDAAKAELRRKLDNFFNDTIANALPRSEKKITATFAEDVKSKQLKIQEILLLPNETIATNREEFVADLVDRLVSGAGVSYSDAQAITEAFTKEYDKLAQKTAEKVLARSVPRTKSKDKILKKSSAERAFEMIKYGAIDQNASLTDKDGNLTDLNDLFSDIFGLPKMNDEIRDNLKIFAEQIAKTKPNSILRQQFYNDMMSYIEFQKIRDSLAGSIILAQIYHNVLFSMDTMVKAFNSNVINMPHEFVTQAIRATFEGDFSLIPLIAKSYFGRKGEKNTEVWFKEGMNNAKLALAGMVETENFNTTNTAEILSKQNESPALKAWGKYARKSNRFLGSIDTLFTSAATGARISDLLYDEIKYLAKQNGITLSTKQIAETVANIQGVKFTPGLGDSPVVKAIAQAKIEFTEAELDINAKRNVKLFRARVMEIVREGARDRAAAYIVNNRWASELDGARIDEIISTAKELASKVGLVGNPPGTFGVLAHFLKLPGKAMPGSQVLIGNMFANAPMNAAEKILQGNTLIGGLVLLTRLVKNQRGLLNSNKATSEFYTNEGIRTEMYGRVTSTVLGRDVNMEKKEMIVRYTMLQAVLIPLSILSTNAIVGAIGKALDDDDEKKEAILKDGIAAVGRISENERHMLFFGDKTAEEGSEEFNGQWKNLKTYVTGPMYGYTEPGAYSKMSALKSMYGIEPYCVYSYGRLVTRYNDNPLLAAIFGSIGANNDVVLFNNDPEKPTETWTQQVMQSSFLQLNLVKDQAAIKPVMEIADALGGKASYSAPGLEDWTDRMQLLAAKKGGSLVSNIFFPAAAKNFNQDMKSLQGIAGKDPREWYDFLTFRVPIIENIIRKEKTDAFDFPIEEKTKRVLPVGTQGLLYVRGADGVLQFPQVDQIMNGPGGKYYAMFKKYDNDQFDKPGITSYVERDPNDEEGGSKIKSLTLTQKNLVRDEYKKLMREFCDDNYEELKSSGTKMLFNLKLKLFLGYYDNNISGYKDYILKKVIGENAFVDETIDESVNDNIDEQFRTR